MNLKAIAAYLERRRLGTRGQSLFVANMPTECKNGILLMGGYHGTRIDHYLPGYIDTEFRLVVRATDFDAGFDLAKRASDALQTHQELVLPGAPGREGHPGMAIKQLLPMNEPRDYRRSVGGFWEFEVDMQISYVNG